MNKAATNINDMHFFPDSNNIAKEPRNVSASMRWGSRWSKSQRRRSGFARARMMPRTAFTSRDDQPVLVKMVRIVFLVA
jgi:hypothetical protein